MKEHKVKSIEAQNQEEYAKKLTLEMNRMERQGFSFTVERLGVSEATAQGVCRAVLTGVREKPVTSKSRPSKGGDAGEVAVTPVQ